ncbi:MAG TPA: hypothetical protein PKE31_07200, partial [Pseudomonadota bacterium]|nr:hypothetical protein [Pseudomonadota bacterium]
LYVFLPCFSLFSFQGPSKQATQQTDLNNPTGLSSDSVVGRTALQVRSYLLQAHFIGQQLFPRFFFSVEENVCVAGTRIEAKANHVPTVPARRPDA